MPQRCAGWSGKADAVPGMGVVIFSMAKPCDLGVAMSSDDVKVLEAAVAVLSRGLDALVGSCLDSEGKPKAPDRGALMRASALLPPYCTHALKKRPNVGIEPHLPAQEQR